MNDDDREVMGEAYKRALGETGRILQEREYREALNNIPERRRRQLLEGSWDNRVIRGWLFVLGVFVIVATLTTLMAWCFS